MIVSGKSTEGGARLWTNPGLSIKDAEIGDKERPLCNPAESLGLPLMAAGFIDNQCSDIIRFLL